MQSKPERLAQRRQLIRHLVQKGISDDRVLAAIEAIPREVFVPPALWDSAYEDSALPIGEGQTISQPYTVAFMCEAAQLRESDHVLEVGTGSGYGAAVLSRICRQVESMERLPGLLEQARQRISQLGTGHVSLHVGDGTLGLPEAAPYDAIIVTAGARHLPPAYVEQLNEGGRVIIPIGDTLRNQSMFRYTRHGNQIQKENLGRFAFVPLIGQEGWQAGAES